MQVIGDDRHRRFDVARADRLVQRKMLLVVFGDPLRR